MDKLQKIIIHAHKKKREKKRIKIWNFIKFLQKKNTPIIHLLYIVKKKPI